VTHVGQDFPLVGCDAGGGKGAGVLCLRHEGADDGNAGAVGGDGVVGWGVRIATFGQNKPKIIDWLKIKNNFFEFESNFFEFGMASWQG
jgi:hypothetical protein